MSKNQKNKIRKDFLELAAALEAACGDWQNAPGMSEESKAALIAKIEEMDRNRQRERGSY